MINISSLDYDVKENDVKFKYFVDLNNIWWYKYDDICEYLEVDINVASSLYKHKINDEDKIECKDNNNEYDIYRDTRFINSNAIRYIVNRRNERANKLIQVINNFEFVEDAHTLYCEADGLRERIESLHDNIEDYDYQGIVYNSWCIVNSKSGRDILDKMGVVNKDVLEFCDIIVDEFGNEFMDIDDIDFKFVVKREGSDEEREIKYKRAKERGNDFKAPAWLKELVK
jgi:hypothetical protein